MTLKWKNEVSSMTIFSQLTCNNNDIMFTFFDDVKSKDGFY